MQNIDQFRAQSAINASMDLAQRTSVVRFIALEDGLVTHITESERPLSAWRLMYGALFDGKRELKIAGLRIVTPGFDKMTAHEQTVLKGLFLKAEVKAQ